MTASQDVVSKGEKVESKILFQQYFKSTGSRTYAAQVKEASTGNHFLVLTEGKRVKKTNQIRKTMLFVFSEDFGEFFNLLRQAEKFVQANPAPEEVKKRQQNYWAKTRRPIEKT